MAEAEGQARTARKSEPDDEASAHDEVVLPASRDSGVVGRVTGVEAAHLASRRRPRQRQPT